MAEKVSMVMATQVAMDVAPAQRSIRSLNTNLNILTRASKAQAASFRAAGDALNASKAEYEGFSTVLSRSKNLLGQLQEQQTHLIDVAKNQGKVIDDLKGKISDLQKERKNADRSTKEGAENYQNLTEKIKNYQQQLREAQHVDTRLNTVNRQIASTTARIAQMTKAQQDADSEYRKQSSGLGELQDKYKQIVAESTAYTDRLKAEGRTTQARYSEIRSLREQRQNLTQQLTKQREELERLENSENQDSSALSRQRIQIEETRKKIADATNTIDKLNGAGSGFHLASAFRAGFRGIDEEAQSTEGRLRELHGVWLGTFVGNIVSNAATSAFTAVKAGIGGLVGAGMQYNRMEQTMTASWNTLTGSASKGKDMQDMLNGLAQQAQNSVPMVDQLAQKMYAVTNSKEKTKDLTKTILTLQDAFHIDDAAIQNFGVQWSQMIGNGKASAQDMLSVQNVFPKFRQELLEYERQVTHNKDLTMSDMNDMMSKGKISSDAMNHVLLSMGQEYKHATQNFASTQDGMLRTIKAMWPKLAGDATKSLMNVESPVFRVVSKWVSDPKTDKEFKFLGTKVSRSVATIFSSLSGVNAGNAVKRMPQLLNGMVNGIGNGMQRLAKFVQQHASEIRTGFGIVTNAFKLTWNVGKQVFKDLVNFIGGFFNSGKKSRSFANNLKAINNVLKGLSKNRAAIKLMADTLIGLFAIKSGFEFMSMINGAVATVGQFATTAGRVVGAIRAVSAAVTGFMATNPITGTILAITALITTLTYLYKHNAKVRAFMNGIGKSVLNGMKGILDGAGRLHKGIADFFTKKIPNAITSSVNAIKKAIHNVIKAIADPIDSFFDSAIKGFNKIADKMHLGKLDPFKVSVNSYATGTGTDRDQMAIVNDAKSGAYREAMYYQGNLSLFPESRNLLTYIPAGAQIINGANTQKLLERLPSFANGIGSLNTQLGTVGNSRGSFTAVITQQLNLMIQAFKRQLDIARREMRKAIARAYRKYQKDTQRLMEKLYGPADDIGQIGSYEVKDDERRQKAQDQLKKTLSHAKSKQSVQHAYDTYNSKIKRYDESSFNYHFKKQQEQAQTILKAKQRKSNAEYEANKTYEKAEETYRQKVAGARKWASLMSQRVSEGSFSTVPHFASGTGTDRDQMAVVNDAKSQNYREALVYNGNISLFPEGRDLLQFIPKGSQILNGENTKKLMESVPHFASGTGAVNTLVSGLNANGQMLHEAERQKFWKKISQQLAKYIKQFKKELQNAIKELNKAIQDAKTQFNKTVYGDKSNGNDDAGLVGERDKSKQEADTKATQAKQEAYRTLTQSVQSAQQAGDKNAIQDAYDTYNDALEDANDDRDDAYSNADSRFQVGVANATASEQVSIMNANRSFAVAQQTYKTNVARAQKWAQANQQQFLQGIPHFANGGIATAPSIFGEAGAEMAIPMTGDPGRAMDLMGQVADNYRSGMVSQNRPDQNQEQHMQNLEAKLDKVATLLASLLEGQGAQTGVIASKQDYNSDQAYSDFSTNLQNEFYGRLS